MGGWMSRISISLIAALLGITLISRAYAGAIIKIDGSSTVYPITEAVAPATEARRVPVCVKRGRIDATRD